LHCSTLLATDSAADAKHLRQTVIDTHHGASQDPFPVMQVELRPRGEPADCRVGWISANPVVVSENARPTPLWTGNWVFWHQHHWHQRSRDLSGQPAKSQPWYRGDAEETSASWFQNIYVLTSAVPPGAEARKTLVDHLCGAMDVASSHPSQRPRLHT
jgi:hypothetical protein